LEVDILEVDILEVDILEVDILEVDILEVDILEVDILEVNTLEVNILEVDILEVDIFEVDIATYVSSTQCGQFLRVPSMYVCAFKTNVLSTQLCPDLGDPERDSKIDCSFLGVS
jgi:hypothetical protein